jgi:hypothetical protein
MSDGHRRFPRQFQTTLDTKKVEIMKLIKVAGFALALLLLALPGTAAAQTYEGTDLDDGIFYVPATPSDGENVNFSVSGLKPNSDLTVNLVDANGNDVDSLQVAGATAFRVGSSGSANINVTLPSGLGNATYSLEVEGVRADDSRFSTSWSFVAGVGTIGPDGAVNDPGANALAFTGSSSGSRILSGVLLVVVGLGLVAIATTRRREHADA